MLKARAGALSLLLLLPFVGGCPGERPRDRQDTVWNPHLDGSLPGLDRAASAEPAGPRPQGKVCSDSGLTFVADRPPLSGGDPITLTVSTGQGVPPYSWVMGGVGAPSAVNWKGGAVIEDLGGGRVSWTFKGIAVPAAPGPYSFYLRKDAVNDDPLLGSVVGSCTP